MVRLRDEDTALIECVNHDDTGAWSAFPEDSYAEALTRLPRLSDQTLLHAGSILD